DFCVVEGSCDNNPYPVRAMEWTSGGTLPSCSRSSIRSGGGGASSPPLPPPPLLSSASASRVDVVVADLSASEACHTRSLLGRAVYNRLFSWLISRLNEALRPKHPGKWRLIGLLDIYGFEVFESNSFEQLIINFCNEKLHQLNVEVALRQEQEEYIREGLDWEPIDYRNNNNICELIERNNHGILSLLDDECSRGRGQVTDENFLLKLTQVCSGHPNFESRGMKTFLADETLPQHCFRVRHFAGNVMYSATGFIEKNCDALPRDLSHAMYRCNHFLLKAMFPEGNPKRAHLKKSATAGAQFKISMGALMKSLTQKTARFVRCIKPNELKQPKKFEYALVQHQAQKALVALFGSSIAIKFTPLQRLASVSQKCHTYRMRFDQTARNRMREKVTASIIFKDRKASYSRSIGHPFLGDYVRLRQNVQWKKMCAETGDQYVVFADIINKINRSSGRFVPVLFVVSTSAMLILDQRTMQIKYRVPATDIYRLSLSPFFDDIAIVHVKVSSPTSENSASQHMTSTTVNPPPNVAGMTSGCLFQPDISRRKGDFIFQTGHVIEIITKLFLVIQNATGKPPEVNIATEFEANFSSHSVLFTFRATGHQQDLLPGQVKISKKGHRMEIVL
ncbi:unnamed protein product, partial [Notodromas monacha]